MRRASVMTMAPFLLTSCTVLGTPAAEEPAYEVLLRAGTIEIRQYPELLVAQTSVEGSFDEVGGTAFRRLAGFIFGNNRTGQDIDMTAPVLQEQTSREIAMTAPVMREKSGQEWTMTFVMPAEYTAETLPEPEDPSIIITKIPGKRVATIRFSGTAAEREFSSKTDELRAWLDENGFRAVSSPRAAGYNPPWTLPFLRRNEVHIDVESAKGRALDSDAPMDS